MEWKPIETAPNPDALSPVLVYDADLESYDVAYVGWFEGHEDEQIPVWFSGDVAIMPTHWMPLPAPPHNPTGEEG